MDINVFADWEGMQGPLLMGVLSIIRTKGHQVTSFDYNRDWIQRGLVQDLDPDLQYYTGHQYLTGEKANFGVFTDSSPDRWGRTLMDISPAGN